MNKKNKGFTLVELLAAIVILGILAVFAIPLISSLMEKSRNKMYVNDAKKLVAEVEYVIRANKIDASKLPGDGECIILNLDDKEVNSSLLDNGPNGGVYDTVNTFVMVKGTATANKYTYSVRTAEKLNKGGYKGIKLTDSENGLTVKNAPNIITSISQSYIYSNKASWNDALGCKAW